VWGTRRADLERVVAVARDALIDREQGELEPVVVPLVQRLHHVREHRRVCGAPSGRSARAPRTQTGTDAPLPPDAPIATRSPRRKSRASTIVRCTSVSNTQKKQSLQICCPVLGRLSTARASWQSAQGRGAMAGADSGKQVPVVEEGKQVGAFHSISSAPLLCTFYARSRFPLDERFSADVWCLQPAFPVMWMWTLAGPMGNVGKPQTPEASTLASFTVECDAGAHGRLNISRIPGGMRSSKSWHLMSRYDEAGHI
jgi:hypothetical protein